MKMALSLYGSVSIESITKKDLLLIMERLKSQSVKLLTVRTRMSVLRAFLRWTTEHEICAYKEFPRLPKAEPEKFVPPTQDELALIWAASPPHLRRVILLGIQCGVRIGPSELFSLKWEYIDFSNNILHVPGAKKNRAAHWREVPLKDSVTDILRVWHEEDCLANLAWIIHYKGQPVKSIKTAWRKVLARVGITRHIRPYDLRHAFATELIANGADIGTVAKLMDHSTPMMVLQHYQYVMDKQKRAAIETLPDFVHVPKKMCPNKKGLTETQ